MSQGSGERRVVTMRVSEKNMANNPAGEGFQKR